MENITLVIPAKNEGDSLPLVLEELKEFDYKKLIVLDKNDIETINAAKNYDCEIYFQSKQGYGNALIEGIDRTSTKLFCIFNADGSFNPKEIKHMTNMLKENNYSLVFGSRYEKYAGSEDDTIITLIGNFFFTRFGKLFFKLNITDILYTFVIGNTDEIKKLNLKEENFNFCVELPIKAHKRELKMCSYPCYERKRIAGKKKVNAFRDGLKILIFMIKAFFIKFK